MSVDGEKTVQERRNDAEKDLASLSRVSHRLAMIDTSEKLSQVLEKLLPRLLVRIGDNHRLQLSQTPIHDIYLRIHSKLVEMLSHTMKRAREDKDCQIPCHGILQLLVTEKNGTMTAVENIDPFTMNLSLAFLTLGISRCQQHHSLFPGFLVLHGSFSAMAPEKLIMSPSTKLQWHQVTHLLFRTMEYIMKLEDHQENRRSSSFSNANTGKRLKQSIVNAENSSNQTCIAVQEIFRRDDIVASACYDFLIDLLLYQTVPGTSTVPPPGISQAGHDRIKGGASNIARDWAAEMAPRSQLIQMKGWLLDFISASRRWGIFMGNSRGKTRTFALLIAAAGDSATEVSEKARTYLKQYCDAEQNTADVYGDSALLIQELLVFCVGANNAQIVLSRQSNFLKFPSLGILYQSLSIESASNQAALSMRRRMVSENTSATMMEFISKILEDVPRLFIADVDGLGRVGNLVILACTKSLSQLQTATGLSMLRAKQYISAAQMLKALAVRLSTLKEHDGVVVALLAKVMGIACDSLTTVVNSTNNAGGSISKGNQSGSEGNIAVRDCLYVVISALSRCHYNLENMFWLFSAGEANASNLSIATATLLFNCISGEVELLRPRAVAALDALLASYCRLISRTHQESSKEIYLEVGEVVMDNPWGNLQERINVEDSVSVSNTDLERSLLPLLWNAARSSQAKQSRVASARWASELLTMIDLNNACHLLCFLAGDTDVTAAGIAQQYLCVRRMTKSQTSHSVMPTADFSSLVSLLFPKSQATNALSRPTYWEFTKKGQAAAIEYLVKCLLNDLYGGEDSMETFLFAVYTSLLDVASEKREDSLTLLDQCAKALSLSLSTSSLARHLLVSESTPFEAKKIYELATTCNSSKARRLLAESWGHIFRDVQIHDAETWEQTVESCLQSCCEIFGSDFCGTSTKHGGAFLGGTAIQAFRLGRSEMMLASMNSIASRLLHLMSKEISNGDDMIGNACTDGIAIALSYRGDDAPILDKHLVAGTSAVLGQLAKTLRKYGSAESLDVPRISKLTKCVGKSLAASTVANTETTEKNIGDMRLECVNALFNLLGSQAFRKDEEVALWVGEALAEYSDAFSPSGITWTGQEDVWPSEYNPEFAAALPPHQQVTYRLLRTAKFENNPQKRTACAPAMFAIVARAAKQVYLHHDGEFRSLAQELSRNLEQIQMFFIALLSDQKSKHLTRESCCLGLAACRTLATLSSTDVSDEMNSRLLRAFGQTTIYGGSAMQETPEQAAERRQAQGISENDEAATSIVDADNGEIGGASGIGEASLGAYREMAGAALSLGRPDLLYAMLMLSVSNPVWYEDGRDYGPSAILGQRSLFEDAGNAVEMRDALKGHLGKLVPRILRGCHSPNRETREQMTNLWNGLTGGGAEARSVITQHLLITIDTLIDDSTNKLWRTRNGACGALSQVLIGRDWQDLGGGPAVLLDDEVSLNSRTKATSAGVRLLRLWRVAIRSLDDVRSNVREAGESLGRTVRSLTLRLVDSNATMQTNSQERSTHDRDASAATATALHFLIKYGLKQQCPEAAGVCISCLIGIVDVANPSILQPLVPDLLRSLLLSMSSLEPAALSYLQVRAAGQNEGSESYDNLERLRIQIVENGPMATAVRKCLEMMPHIDLKIQRLVVPELDNAIRLSAGTITRTVTADCIATLCTTCPNAFVTTGMSSSNSSVSLLRALYAASERERGQTARDKYAHAFGSLASLCPGSSVRSLASKAAEKYTRSTGNNDDPAARKAAAITLRAIAVKASDHFSDGGSTDLWSRRILPIAYLGMKDSDSKVASLFSDVWEEGGSVVNQVGAADGFGSLLEEKILLPLVTECVRALQDVSWSRRVTGASALQDLANKEILSPAPRRLEGANSDLNGLLRSQTRSQASQIALASLASTIADTRLWSGKATVVDACCAMASKWAFSIANTSEPKSVFGYEKGTPVWKPLQLEQSTNLDDLFVSDGRFQKVLTGEDNPEESASMATSTDVASQCLDFKEENKTTVFDNELSANKNGTLTFSGLCRMLLFQAFPSKRSTLSVKDEEILPYRIAVLKNLSHLLHSIDEAQREKEIKKCIFSYITSALIPLLKNIHGIEESMEESPILISRAIDCIASCFWESFGENSREDLIGSDIFENTFELSEMFKDLSAIEVPWTVKVSALLAFTRLILKASPVCLQRHATVSNAVICASFALRDRKFWKVRNAGLEVLHSIVRRCGQGSISNYQNAHSKSQEQQLVLETALPEKETILKLAKKSLQDTEARNTALATKIVSSMAWWP